MTASAQGKVSSDAADSSYLFTRDVLAAIRSLDPERDAHKIALLSSTRHFVADAKISLELALFRTYAVPTIGGLLHSTREFADRPQKRYDDTSILISEFLENGLDSERGQAALQRMNAMHSRYKIANDDFLYVLSTFIYEPIRWNERYGWRPLLEQEKVAVYKLWCTIGESMGIKDIPSSYEAFDSFNRNYERERFRFNPASQKVGEATLNLFTSWYPRPLRPLIRQSIFAVLDAPVRRAFGFPDPWPFWAWLIPCLLKLRARLLAILPKRKKPFFRHRVRYKTYPEGHSLDKVGAEAKTL